MDAENSLIRQHSEKEISATNKQSEKKNDSKLIYYKLKDYL